MVRLLSCYYLDRALADEELRFAERTLTGPWARFHTGAAGIAQKRVPAVLPLPQDGDRYAQDRWLRAQKVRSHLRHAGIDADRGRQVLWVMPQDPDWDTVFRLAIQQETGLAPYVAQRWFSESGTLVQRALQIVDTQWLLNHL